MSAVPSPIIALIHAGTSSITPTTRAFASAVAPLQLWHLIDDRLVTEADAVGGLTPQLHHRMAQLIRYAVDGGAVAVQLACSMYGPVASAADYGVPVHASDEAAFRQIAAHGYASVAIIGSLQSAVTDSRLRLIDFLTAAGTRATVRTEVLPAPASGTPDELALGDPDLADVDVDVILIAQYSLLEFGDALSARTPVPVLNPARLAAAALHDAVVARS